MPQTEPQETDPAEAFEAMRRELSLLHRAIEGLTAARENIPDYSETLGGMDQAIRAVGTRLHRIEESPAVSLSPAAMAWEMNEAAKAVRAEDSKMLHEACDALSRSLEQLDSSVTRKRTTDQQFTLLLWAATGSFVTGILLWSILPGAVARSLPASWHVPEWMAARTMRMEQQDAGERMIRAAI